MNLRERWYWFLVEHNFTNRLLGFFTWTIGRRLRWWVCFVVGHNVEPGERIHDGTGYSMKISDDFCERCWHTEKDMDLEWKPVTLPYYLNRAYSWLVERDWEWFARLDEWLTTHHARRMPKWWNY